MRSTRRRHDCSIGARPRRVDSGSTVRVRIIRVRKEETVDRLLTGEAYLESLRDGREGWIDGERAADVTAPPAFRNAARSVAGLYDAMHDPETRDVLVSTDSEGLTTHRFFRPSYSS